MSSGHAVIYEPRKSKKRPPPIYKLPDETIQRLDPTNFKPPPRSVLDIDLSCGSGIDEDTSDSSIDEGSSAKKSKTLTRKELREKGLDEWKPLTP
ncbi:hypothetical protein N7540_003408 [Penicillium herquei]|nr:hypothetical protein N7540_003408 [Penicillium herquei]